MKASDFTTGGNDREKAMSNLLKTEKTDAVNTGLVEKADKSAKALKGDLYSVGKKGAHGAGSTALDAIARKRKKTSAADALDGKSRSQITGKNALTKKVQSRHNLNKSLKHGAKGVAAKATHNALKDSELEGTDDLVATTHTGAKLAGKARKHLRSGKDALEKKDSLCALSEKKYRTEKLDKKAAQKRMQFSKYFHRNVYENAAAQAGADYVEKLKEHMKIHKDLKHLNVTDGDIEAIKTRLSTNSMSANPAVMSDEDITRFIKSIS